ncbi:MAG TPA: hypothetical protein VGV38_02665 [Pyrinomonadaceae bacterium]|nr:hypothetical protein [Pyrinomonadaceae bacterium]
MSEEARGADELAGALAPLERSQFMPAMSIELAVERYNAVTEFISRVLRRDVDYGVIPGTDKLTLLKPGAEKLTTFFGLSTRFQLLERIEDWTGAAYGGEPFFYYLYRCRLYRGDLLIAEADGSCNSREQKYRWREAQRTCPECGQAAIIKGREEYGGGYVCFRKKGGCGAKFLVGDATIESQQTGRVPNADIADQVNTLQKMGQKRALVGATLLAVNASEFFTQDVEDLPSGAGVVVREVSLLAPDEGAPGGGSRPQALTDVVREREERELLVEIFAACHQLGKNEAQLVDYLRRKYGAEGVESLPARQKYELLAFLQSKLARQPAA